MSKILGSLRRRLRERRGLKNEHVEWVRRSYSSPSPAHIKRSVLLRLGVPNATWVETGTFLGETAELLASHSKAVYTIEPEATLYKQAAQRLANNQKIHVIHGLSEKVLPDLLPGLSGTVNFWLDGHYSGGITHQGPVDCPVRDELMHIENNLSRFDDVVVLIDDIRCFDPSIELYADYPDLNYLVDWARRNGLKWSIEHDIFAAVRKAKSA